MVSTTHGRHLTRVDPGDFSHLEVRGVLFSALDGPHTLVLSMRIACGWNNRFHTPVYVLRTGLDRGFTVPMAMFFFGGGRAPFDAHTHDPLR